MIIAQDERIVKCQAYDPSTGLCSSRFSSHPAGPSTPSPRRGGRLGWGAEAVPESRSSSSPPPLPSPVSGGGKQLAGAVTENGLTLTLAYDSFSTLPVAYAMMSTLIGT